jgi:hypothetical protein
MESAVADPRCSRPRRLHSQPPFRLASGGEEVPEENFIFNRNWGSFTPVAYIAGYMVIFSASSEVLRFHLLYSRNSSLDVSSLMVILAVSPLVASALFEDCREDM